MDYDAATINSVPEIAYFYQSFEAVHANRWQFPLLVQYRFSIHKISPFVETGPAISTIGNSKGSFSSTSATGLAKTTSSNSISAGRATLAGITAGGGVDLPVLHVRVRPEFRYSRWFQSKGVNGIPGVGFEWFLLGDFSARPFNLEQNEASFLLSLSF